MISQPGTKNGQAAEGTSGAGGATDRQNNADPAASIQAAMGVLLAQAATYVAAKRDLLQLRLRTLAILIAVGFLAFIALISLVASVAVLLVVGTAGALAAGFDIPIWAGQLITSLTAVVVGALFLYVSLVYLRHSSLRRTIARYEHRRRSSPVSQSRPHSPANAAAS